MSEDRHDGERPRAGTAATALLERIGRLARQAKDTAEQLAGRLLERTVQRPRQELAPEPEPELELEPKPEPRAEVEAASRAQGPALVEPDRDPDATGLTTVDDDLPELPASYGDARVVLLARDPQWLFCYWDLPGEDRRGPTAQGERLALRLHDVTDLEFDGQNSWSQHLYPMTEGARWWHVSIPRVGRHYLAEVGRLAPSGAFTVLGRSTATTTPPPGPSPRVGEQMATLPLDEPPSGGSAHEGTGLPPSEKADYDAATLMHGWLPADDYPGLPPTSTSSGWSVPR